MSDIGIEIAAAGKAERLREYITQLGYPEDFPKSLLPVTDGGAQTLLAKIIDQALEAPVDGPIVVHTSPINERYIREHPGISPFLAEGRVETRVGIFNNFFGPFLPKLIETRTRVLGSSADFYADLVWEDVLDAHESHGLPVTFMAGQTIPVRNGLAFEVTDHGKITSFERMDQTTGEELVNIGVYVFDPAPAVLSLMAEVVSGQHVAKPELVAQRLIDKGLLGAYVLPDLAFNVNSPETYGQLLDHTRTRPIDAKFS